MDEQKKRLYDLIVDADNEFYRETPTGTAAERIEKLADYLLANGVLVPLCKVGDTVYQIDAERVYEHKVTNIIYETPQIAFDKRAIENGNILLTRKAAEAALKERQEKE